MNDLIAFLGVSALVIVTPGQDTALTIRNVLLGGRVGGVFTTIGVCAGQATWALATSVGISALVVASETAFATLKLLGSGYLIFLGVRAFYEALRSRSQAARFNPSGPSPRLTPLAALRQGLLSNLANPKMLAFFTSLLPQFASSPTGLLTLGLLFCSLTLAWLTAYTFVVARAGALLRTPRVRRVLEALTGTVLIALGTQLAMERR